MFSQKDIDRFWSKVDKSGGPDACWPWTGGKTGDGYGTTRMDGKTMYAHRVSWAIENGEIPKGMDICHHCDNPPCCNPKCLFCGTRLENVRDCIRKGRHAAGPKHGSVTKPDRTPKGSWSGMAKLDEATVLRICEELDHGLSQYKAAEKYGVTRSAIGHIAQGSTWNHITRRRD